MKIKKKRRSPSKMPVSGIEPFLVKISEKLQISYSSYFDKSRTDHIVMLRYCLWYYLETTYGYGPRHIAMFFSKDHSTVIYGIGQATWRIKDYDDYRGAYKLIKTIFESL